MKMTNSIIGIALCFVSVWAYAGEDVSRAEISLERNERAIYTRDKDAKGDNLDQSISFKEARTLAWQEAYYKYPELLELRATAKWSTPVGLMFKMLDESKNILEYKERLAEIIKALELNKH